MRKLLRMAVIIGSTVAALMLVPTSASAATCYASSCTFKDPQATGCAADAFTAKSAVRSGRTVELRYSPTCRAAWARLRNGQIGDYFRVWSSGDPSFQGRISEGTSGYTKMVNDAGKFAWACTEYIGPAPDTCTGTY
jgi:hypothetical protein